jgi:hypothetical protein
VADNWDQAKAELDASLATLKNQVASLYNDNVLTNDDGTPSGLPYGKQAAGFNDLRALAATLGPQKSQVDGQTYPIGDYLVSIDRKLSTLIDTVTALAAKQNK